MDNDIVYAIINRDGSVWSTVNYKPLAEAIVERNRLDAYFYNAGKHLMPQTIRVQLITTSK